MKSTLAFDEGYYAIINVKLGAMSTKRKWSSYVYATAGLGHFVRWITML